MNRTATTHEAGNAPEHPLSGCFVVDVRTPAEFRALHIAGALNVPLPDVDGLAPQLRERAEGRRVVLVCRTGQRAEKALEALRGAGAAGIDLEVLEGGLVRWEDDGRPVRRGRAAMSLERQVRIAAGSLVVLGVALGVLVHPGFLGLAEFVGAGLVFAGVTDTCGMGMILARMPWNRVGPGVGLDVHSGANAGA
ncbi:MAG: rhodanese-like domain-containing protein [Planctomycetota bacterium]